MHAYHYTSPQKHEAMLEGNDWGYGLLPIARFVPTIIPGLPQEAYETAAIFNFPEEKPVTWVENTEFPEVWHKIVSHVSTFSSSRFIRCVRFKIKEQDVAYVVERAFVERMKQRQSTSKQSTKAYVDYWESKVLLREYRGDYCLPEIVLFSAIEAQRLEEVWTKPLAEVKAFAQR